MSSKDMKTRKYVVIQELPEGGYMDCVAICDTAVEAYGHAYSCLCGGVADGFRYEALRDKRITMADYREGENGMVMCREDLKTGETEEIMTVLFYEDESQADEGE